MSDNFSKIDGRTLKRFARATRRIETTPNNPRRERAARDGNRSGEFWVEITAYDSEDKLYSWKPLYFSASKNNKKAESWQGSEIHGRAVELYGSEVVLIGSKVKIEPTDKWYVFRYSPGILSGSISAAILPDATGAVSIEINEESETVDAKNTIGSEVGSSASAEEPTQVIVGYSELQKEWIIIAEGCQ